MLKFHQIILSITVALFIVSCTAEAPEAKEDTSSNEQLGQIAELIRNPATAEGSADTSNMAHITFEEEIFNFGTVDEGAVVKHSFNFTNSGDVPLIISDVRSTCGCTIADWPGGLIEPGKGGKIDVRFDTNNKTGNQGKPITITANTYPAKHELILKGFVDEKIQ